MTVQRLLSNHTIHSRSLPIDIEICAEDGGQGSSQKTAEIHLTKEMIITVAHLIGNEELLQTLSDTKLECGASIELFPEQLAGDGTEYVDCLIFSMLVVMPTPQPSVNMI